MHLLKLATRGVTLATSPFLPVGILAFGDLGREEREPAQGAGVCFSRDKYSMEPTAAGRADVAMSFKEVGGFHLPEHWSSPITPPLVFAGWVWIQLTCWGFI